MPKAGPVFAPGKAERLREALRWSHEPSARACDPNHPVGATAEAIRNALPQFRPWQVNMAQIDLNEAARHLHDGRRAAAFSYLLPPGFADGPSGAYLTAQRSLLIEDEDGAVLTMGALLDRKTTREAFHRQMRIGSRWSDALDLIWKQVELLELRAVEELLRNLSEKIVPGVDVRFLPRREPRFRAALRMQLGDHRIPAATGGVLNRCSVVPEDVQVASVTIHLEPWAAARTGQVVEFAEDSPFPWSGRPE